MKTYVIILSKTFPKSHPLSGQETGFGSSFKSGQKIHTVRGNYLMWIKRFEEVQKGTAVLSVREWTGTPYRSPQRELARLTAADGVGIQALKLKDLWSSTAIDGEKVELPDLAAHDGLSFADWYYWFRKVDLRQPMAIIHFTKFRYGKTSDSR